MVRKFNASINYLRFSQYKIFHKATLFRTALIIFCLFFMRIGCADNFYHLIFAVDLVRHGDRSPSTIIPADPHPWPQGLKELTPRGMNQLYRLGVSLRQEYINKDHLLPQKFNVNTLYVRSTDIDRTLMSTESLLLGLYPLKSGPTLFKNHYALPGGFQPIPIHTVTANQDDLFLLPPGRNQQFQKLLWQYVYSQPAWQKKEAELQPKFSIWSEQTGYPLHRLQDITPLGDALKVRNIYGIAPPATMRKTDVEQILALENWIVTNKFKPKAIGKFLAENFLAELKNNMNNAATNRSSLKVIIYLAHDTDILGIMSGLGIPLELMPPYASDLRFELLQDSEKRDWVKIIYNNKIQKLSACETLCPLPKFFSLINS